MPPKNPQKPDDESRVLKLQEEIFQLLKEKAQKETEDCRKKIDTQNEKIARLRDDISSIHDNEASVKEQIDSQIRAFDDKVQSKLDGIDAAFRGNGRVGLFEEMRNMKMRIRVLMALVLVLLGARVLGLTLEGWVKGLFGIDVETKQVQPVETPPSTPNAPSDLDEMEANELDTNDAS